LLLSPLPGCADDGLGPDDPAEQESDGADEDGAASVCIEQCKPLEQDCGPGQACLPDQPGFSCVTLQGGGTHLGLHEPCDAGSQPCDAGLVCLQVLVPGCSGGTACCVAICDMEDPQCTDDTVCEPFFAPSQMCYEDVGACVL